MRAVVVAVAAAAALTGSVAAAAPRAAPDVALATLGGASVRTADLKGKVVLIDFWASWCIPCRRSFPEIDALSRELGPKGVVVLAVNVDEQRRNAEAFLAEHPHTMTIALDPRGVAAEAFALQAMPSTVIVDRAGRIRFLHEGYTEKTAQQFRSELLRLLAEEQ